MAAFPASKHFYWMFPIHCLRIVNSIQSSHGLCCLSAEGQFALTAYSWMKDCRLFSHNCSFCLGLLPCQHNFTVQLVPGQPSKKPCECILGTCHFRALNDKHNRLMVYFYATKWMWYDMVSLFSEIGWGCVYFVWPLSGSWVITSIDLISLKRTRC